MKTLDEKIKELKLRAGAIQYSNVTVSPDGELSNDRKSDFGKRIVAGYALVWGKANMFGEVMLKGCCAKSISERGPNSNAKYKITHFWQHDPCDPLAVFDILEEDDYGLYFRTKPLDEVPNANRELIQLASGTLNQFSVGFDYVWDKIDWDSDNDYLILKEIDLFEISVVTIGADSETYAIRSKENVTYLHDETEGFIKSLPRNLQLEARSLFTRHKALMNKEPFEQRKTTLDTDQPTTGSINYDYLITHLNQKK